MKVNGKDISNQFIICTDNEEYFQSYKTIIAKKVYTDNDILHKIFLDEDHWDYSKTTSKYRNLFLGDSNTAEARTKIKDGTYILTDLNNGDDNEFNFTRT
jgi:hypothetical protein